MNHLKTEPRYNIITGQQVKNNYRSVQRSFSSDQGFQKTRKVQILAKQALNVNSYNKNTILGKPKDYKQFQYSYDLNTSELQNSNRLILPQVITNRQTITNREKPALSNFQPNSFKHTMNHVSVPYNFINYSDQFPTSTIIDKSAFNGHITQANRRNPLTKPIDESNMFKQHFHIGYEDRVNSNIFRRRKEVCGDICEVAKSYNFGKYFRKYK